MRKFPSCVFNPRTAAAGSRQRRCERFLIRTYAPPAPGSRLGAGVLESAAAFARIEARMRNAWKTRSILAMVKPSTGAEVPPALGRRVL